MDPASYCVFNLTRSALLSERVVSVSEPQTPSQLLALVMNGPGRDPHFCIRLTNVSSTPELPRLFAFDVAYLDAEQRILEVADVGPASPFPALTENVATILFLSDQLLSRSGTEPGDFIRICTQSELAALLRASAQFQEVRSSGWPIESSLPSSAVPPDPFAGSLIYLPSSGTPQTSEIFLATRAVASDVVDPLEEIAGPEPLAESFTPKAEISDEQQPVIEEMELREDYPPVQFEGGPAAEAQVAARFFETGSQPPSLTPAPPEETHAAVAPRPSQLPFNLQAVIQLVDDQLRREKQQEQALPQLHREKSRQPERVELPERLKVPELQDSRPAPDQPASSPAQEESAEILPGLSTGYIPDVPEIKATALDVPALNQSHSVAGPASKEVTLRQEQLPPAISPERVQSFEPSAEAPASMAAPHSAQLQAAPHTSEAPPSTSKSLSPEPIAEPERPRIPPKEKLPFASRVQRWLAGESISLSGNRRRGERIALPGLVAFYFTGGAPTPHEIVNISTSGLYLRSKELWSPNTLVRMTLERQDSEIDEKKSISVLARVVRVDEGGIGHEFVTTEILARLHARDFLPQQGTNRKELEKFLAAPK